MGIDTACDNIAELANQQIFEMQETAERLPNCEACGWSSAGGFQAACSTPATSVDISHFHLPIWVRLLCCSLEHKICSFLSQN